MPSRAVEDYLKAIYKLSGDEEPATTSAVAERLGVAAGSVTGMLRRLAEQGLVRHVPYYGARLTAKGEADALRLIRRHRVIELFLVEVLGYTWDRVHEEAERLEHAASDELVDRMAKVLGEPEVDPHGAPIPGADRTLEDTLYPSLAELDAGDRAVMKRVSDQDSDVLRYLGEQGLTPGVEFEVIGREPFGGPIRVRIGPDERIIGRELALLVWAERLDERAATTTEAVSGGSEDE